MRTRYGAPDHMDFCQEHGMETVDGEPCLGSTKIDATPCDVRRYRLVPVDALVISRDRIEALRKRHGPTATNFDFVVGFNSALDAVIAAAQEER